MKFEWRWRKKKIEPESEDEKWREKEVWGEEKGRIWEFGGERERFWRMKEWEEREVEVERRRRVTPPIIFLVLWIIPLAAMVMVEFKQKNKTNRHVVYTFLNCYLHPLVILDTPLKTIYTWNVFLKA